MPIFSYKGRTKSGEVASGEIEAPSISAAATILKREQVIPHRIKEHKTSSGLLKRNISLFSARVKSQDVIVFTRMFATMIDAGLPLVQCLDTLQKQQHNPEFKSVLDHIKEDIEGGATLADALKSHPKVFDELYVNLVAAAEMGGILDSILKRLALLMEKTRKIKNDIKGALAYPAVVMTAAFFIVTGLLLFVVPIFQRMFVDMGQALPLPTLVVVRMSGMLKSYWYLFFALLAGCVYGVRRYYGTDKGRLVIDGAFLKMPIFGGLVRKASIARFARTLGTLVSSGIPILDALDIVARTAGNKVVEGAIVVSRKALSEGRTLAEPLEETKVFPDIVTQMISVGESSGSLDMMLNKIADFYEEELETAISALTSLIEPVVMVFLGLIVGGLVIALYLPIFQLAGSAG